MNFDTIENAVLLANQPTRRIKTSVVREIGTPKTHNRGGQKKTVSFRANGPSTPDPFLRRLEARRSLSGGPSLLVFLLPQFVSETLIHELAFKQLAPCTL